MAAFMAQYLKEKSGSEDVQIAELLSNKGFTGFTTDPTFDFVCGEVSRMWRLQFNPCSSVIGSTMSQEVIKVVTQRDHPGHGLFVYDSVH
jgi:hypothetical protein